MTARSSFSPMHGRPFPVFNPDTIMNWQQLSKLGRELPEVMEGVWYGTPALKARSKGFVRLKEDGESVVFLLDDVDDQELLIADRPEIYYITDHYRGYSPQCSRVWQG